MLKKICTYSFLFVFGFSYSQKKEVNKHPFLNYGLSKDSLISFKNYKYYLDAPKSQKKNFTYIDKYKMPIYECDTISKMNVFTTPKENKYKLKIYNPESSSN